MKLNSLFSRSLFLL